MKDCVYCVVVKDGKSYVTKLAEGTIDYKKIFWKKMLIKDAPLDASLAFIEHDQEN